MIRCNTCLYCNREIPTHMTCNCPQSILITTYCSECDDLRTRITELEAVVAAAKHVITPDLNEHYLSMGMSELADAIATLDGEDK